MTDPVFLFGTLRYDPLRRAVLGGECPAQLAQLPDHDVIDRNGYPALMDRMGTVAQGMVVSPDAGQLARLDLYEGLFGYARARATDAKGRAVWVYRPAETSPYVGASAWQLEEWVIRFGEAATLASAEVLSLARRHPAEHLAVRYPMLLAHAAARLRARSETSPHSLRRTAAPDDVIPLSTSHPYAYFFGVQSDDLRFRRFDGTSSEVVRRAGFVMSDATTVLPYDPVRDCVMLAEQFRYGPYLRNAANCWSLEAISGRVDAGETPQQAALREAHEEAGLTLGLDALLSIGQSYPSPGSITEFLYQYLALCDLPQDDGAIGGLASEHEDIRRHVISFDRLMELVQTGEVQNGPLLTSAYWLALNRDRLRGG